MSSAHRSDILSIVRNIHAATGKDEQWNSVLSDLGHLLSARIALLMKHTFSTGCGTGLYESKDATEINRIYTQHFSVRNPWFLSSSHYEEGQVIVGTDLLRKEDLVATDFYKHFLKPNGLFHRLCGVVNRNQDTVYYVTFLRGEDEQEFNEQERGLLALLLDHLTISLQNHWRLLHANDFSNILRSAMNRFSNTIMVVDRNGKVLHRNAKSEEFLKRYAALQLTDESIGALFGTDHRALLQAIGEVADKPYGNSSDNEKVVTITNPNCEQPILININPLGCIYSMENAETVSVVILTIRDPNQTHHPRSCSFSRLYELTPAQSRLSSLVFSGYTLPNAAKYLNVSENTVRSHLKQIYQKTHTHGQMELVHLHAKICTDHI